MPLVPSSIIQICSTSHSNVFDGDVLALYGPGQNKSPGSPIKAPFMHADLVDKNGQLTMTVNINNSQIARFLSYFSVGKSVRIKDFATKKKGMYDRGDAKYTILLQQASSVENIPQVCQQRKLAPDSTIHEVLVSNDTYSIGSVAALVINCEPNNNKFDLTIKDGDTPNDIAIVRLLASTTTLSFYFVSFPDFLFLSCSNISSKKYRFLHPCFSNVTLVFSVLL